MYMCVGEVGPYALNVSWHTGHLKELYTFPLSLLLPCSLLCLIPSPHISPHPFPPSLSAALQDIRARVEHILIGPLHCH